MNRTHTPKANRKSAAYVAALLTLGTVCAYGQAALPAPAAAEPAPASEAEALKQKKAAEAVKKAEAQAKSEVKAEGQDEIIQLSPFVVESDNDDSYMASNTMGSRINSKLDDVAASISVVTKQQLSDFALVDINDIFALEANTEGTGNYTATSNLGNSQQEVDDVAVNRQSANRVRGLGAANIAVGNFAASANIPIDTYNVDAVEISRGPNSNVFGAGDASGVVNLVPAAANLSKPFSRTSVMGTSRGTVRGTIDINRPLFKDILGIRVLGAATNEKFERKPSYDDTRRLTAGITFRPFRNTTIRFSYENFEEEYKRPNSYTPRDLVTPWQNAGRPSWDPTTKTFYYYNADGSVARSGAVSLSNGTTDVYASPMTGTGTPSGDQVYLSTMGSSRVRPTMGIDNGVVSWYQPTYIGIAAMPLNTAGVPVVISSNGIASGNANELTAVRYAGYYNVPQEYRTATAIGFPSFTSTTDTNFYDWRNVNISGANFGRKTARFTRLELEQYFLTTQYHTIAAQFGLFKEDILDYSRVFVGNGRDGVAYDILPDVNLRLLDGSLNPNYGSPYLTALSPKTLVSPIDTLTKKVNAVYQLDLTRHKNKFLRAIGRQRLLGYYESINREAPSQALFYNDQIIDTFNGKFYSTNGLTANQGTTTVYGPSGALDNWLQGGYRSASGTRQPNSSYGIRADSQAIWNVRYYLGDNSGNIDYGSSALNTNQVSFRRYGNNTGYTKVNGAYPLATPSSNSRNPYVYTNAADPFFWSDETVNIGTELVGVGGNMQRSVFKSKGFVYQGYFWGDRIIPTLGFREDTLQVQDWKGWSAITDIDPITGFYGDISPAFNYDTPYKVFNSLNQDTYARGSTSSKGIVIKPFNWISLRYNESTSQKPVEYGINLQGEPLENPNGKTTDYGVRINISDKLSLGLTKYKTVSEDVRMSQNTAWSRIVGMDVDAIGINSRHDIVDWYANELALSRGVTMTGVDTDPVDAAILADTYKAVGIDPAFIAEIEKGRIFMTTDEKSEGYEAELFWRPNRWFSMKMTGSKTEAMTTYIASSFQKYRDSRWETWTTITSPNAQAYRDIANNPLHPDYANYDTKEELDAAISYWQRRFSDTGNRSVEAYYYADIENQVKLNYALQGKPKPQVRKYKFNVMPAVRLSGLTKHRILRNVAFGGSMRWEDKGAIGFYGQDLATITPDANGQKYVRAYDADRPIYDKSHAYFDFWGSYGFKMFRDRVRGSVQLNVLNAFESGSLRAFSARPDGTIQGYRIIDPREFKLTVSFDL